MFVDLIVCTLFALAMVAGYMRGAIVSVVAIGLIAGGAALGAGIGAFVGGHAVAYGGLVGAILMAVPIAFRVARFTAWVRATPAGARVSQADRPVGAVLVGMLSLAMAWVVGVVAAIAPAETALVRTVSTSRIIAALTSLVPPTGAVATVMLRSGLLPAMDGPLIIASDPDDEVLVDPRVQQARAGVVHVTGRSCGVIASGTGWVIRPRFVVTNAHVVAGMSAPFVVQRGMAAAVPASVVAFEPQQDIAILQVPGLALPALAIAPEPRHDEAAAIIGYPRRDGLVYVPARFDRIVTFPMKDIYDAGEFEADIAVFRGDVRPGNSGSPMVNAAGQVMATVTANAYNQRIEGGYAVPNRVVLEVMASATHRVSTGPCIVDDPAPDSNH